MTNTKSTLRCCECDRPVVNRLFDKCLYCGAELDAEITLTQEEKSRLRAKEMQKLNAERKARIEREEQRSNSSSGLSASDVALTTLGLFGFMFFLD